jgi:outer membrane protein OmpA-like peptidoglycan-associated protein
MHKATRFQDFADAQGETRGGKIGVESKVKNTARLLRGTALATILAVSFCASAFADGYANAKPRGPGVRSLTNAPNDVLVDYSALESLGGSSGLLIPQSATRRLSVFDEEPIVLRPPKGVAPALKPPTRAGTPVLTTATIKLSPPAGMTPEPVQMAKVEEPTAQIAPRVDAPKAEPKSEAPRKTETSASDVTVEKLAPPKPAPAKAVAVAPPKVEAPKVEPAKQVLPKAEQPKAATPPPPAKVAAASPPPTPVPPPAKTTPAAASASRPAASAPPTKPSAQQQAAVQPLTPPPKAPAPAVTAPAPTPSSPPAAVVPPAKPPAQQAAVQPLPPPPKAPAPAATAPAPMPAPAAPAVVASAPPAPNTAAPASGAPRALLTPTPPSETKPESKLAALPSPATSQPTVPAETEKVDAPEVSAQETKPVETQTAALPAKALSQPDTLTISFAVGVPDIPGNANAGLNALAARMKSDASLRVQLLAFASDPEKSVSRSRRLSLERAVNVRKQLLSAGIDSTRIEVRALGEQAGDGAPDRVDAITSKR